MSKTFKLEKIYCLKDVTNAMIDKYLYQYIDANDDEVKQYAFYGKIECENDKIDIEPYLKYINHEYVDINEDNCGTFTKKTQQKKSLIGDKGINETTNHKLKHITFDPRAEVDKEKIIVIDEYVIIFIHTDGKEYKEYEYFLLIDEDEISDEDDKIDENDMPLLQVIKDMYSIESKTTKYELKDKIFKLIKNICLFEDIFRIHSLKRAITEIKTLYDRLKEYKERSKINIKKDEAKYLDKMIKILETIKGA